MKKILIPVVIVVAVGLGYLVWNSPSQANQPAAVRVAPAPEVAVVTMQEEEVRLTTELPGRTAVYQMAEIRPQVGGIIQKRAFTEGAEIKAGQLLYQIDPSTYEVAVARAKAAVAKAKAELEPARLKAIRYRDLIRTKAVSQQDHDEVQAGLALAEANVAAAQAELGAAHIDLERTKVLSPISGRIGRSTITPGALVTANQAQAMATVQQLDPIYVDLTQSNTELLRMKHALKSGAVQSAGEAATKVSLILEDGAVYAHEGVLQLAEASVDQSTGSVTLRAVFPNPERDLLPGMYVRAVVEEGVLASALLIPQQAVVRNAEGQPLAMVVDGEEKVAARPLELDRAVGGDWIVRQGLAAGDRVVIEGLQKARPGVQVRVAQDAM
ncbi:efflux RND transporter periplasmic adaptor subunit [Desulfomicrobium baculatum]|uniref:Efflux transporter, RND family, MFP subunit n=1 Tax=Desulfomicrobium baculatum (strain DSM 4028 / VKM B-1378 / X) TaxID=525897 RepID=C7LSL8_DESBD|nr:efflux RND transporter periplasmic adaptor subunit [Desulfomicrobium baculatum]ACU88232.1 efflux transporter, RND family, MFP subunit [Desulfomicrobium baculatum DSM 4028]